MTPTNLTNYRHTIYLRAELEKRPVSAFIGFTCTQLHIHVGAMTMSDERKETSDKIANRHVPIDPAAKSYDGVALPTASLQGEGISVVLAQYMILAR